MSAEPTKVDYSLGCVIVAVPVLFLLLRLAWRLHFRAEFSPW